MRSGAAHPHAASSVPGAALAHPALSSTPRTTGNAQRSTAPLDSIHYYCLPAARTSARRPSQMRSAVPPLLALGVVSGASLLGPRGERYLHSRIKGDGRCLFRALYRGTQLAYAGQRHPNANLSLTMPEADGADLVRSLACDELERRRQEFEPFVTAEASFEVYLKLMRSYWTWGGEPELACAPDVLSLAVDVFAAGEERRLRLVNQYRPSSELLGNVEKQSQTAATPATCTQRGAVERKTVEQEPAGKVSELLLVRLFFHEHGHYDLLVPSTESRL